MSSHIKPTLDEVLAYAEPQIKNWISKEAKNLPFEQIEEILQEGFLRIIKAYEGLDPEKGWKAFVYNHARGAVLDYLKGGHGFTEERWSIAKPEEHESRNVSKIRSRVGLVNEEGENMSVDFVLGMNGEFDERVDRLKLDWDLLSRLAYRDKGVNCFARLIQGYSIEEIAQNQGLSRARVGQIIDDFVSRFDDPDEAFNPWFQQVCFALGLSHKLGFPNERNQYACNDPKVDIFNTEAMPPEEDPQMDLFVFVEEASG